MQDFNTAGQFGQPPRIPALPSQEGPMSGGPVPPLRIPSLAESATNAQGYSYSASHHPHSSPQSSTHGSQSSHPYWDANRPNRSEQNRPPAPSWPVLPALDTNVTRQRSGTINTLSSRSDAFPSHVPNRPWSSSASSATSSSSGGAPPTHYSNAPFPTLASPYYPAQSPSQRSVDASVSSPTAQSGGSPEYFSSSYHRSSVRHSGGAEQGGFAGSPTLPHPASPAYLSNASSSSQWSPQYGRSGAERPQSNLQPISTYPLPSASSASPPPSSSGTQSSQMEYWNRR